MEENIVTNVMGKEVEIVTGTTPATTTVPNTSTTNSTDTTTQTTPITGTTGSQTSTIAPSTKSCRQILGI